MCGIGIAVVSDRFHSFLPPPSRPRPHSSHYSQKEMPFFVLQQRRKSRGTRPSVDSFDRLPAGSSLRSAFIVAIALHNHTAAAALLGSVRILTLGNDSPHRRDHVISSAVAVGNDALAGLADGNSFPLEILAQSAVELCQSTQLQICHALLVLLDLRRVADVSACVLRHFGRQVGGCGRGMIVAADSRGWER